MDDMDRMSRREQELRAELQRKEEELAIIRLKNQSQFPLGIANERHSQNQDRSDFLDCNYCNVRFFDETTVREHLVSRTHLDNVQRAQNAMLNPLMAPQPQLYPQNKVLPDDISGKAAMLISMNQGRLQDFQTLLVDEANQRNFSPSGKEFPLQRDEFHMPREEHRMLREEFPEQKGVSPLVREELPLQREELQSRPSLLQTSPLNKFDVLNQGSRRMQKEFYVGTEQEEAHMRRADFDRHDSERDQITNKERGGRDEDYLIQGGDFRQQDRSVPEIVNRFQQHEDMARESEIEREIRYHEMLLLQNESGILGDPGILAMEKEKEIAMRFKALDDRMRENLRQERLLGRGGGDFGSSNTLEGALRQRSRSRSAGRSRSRDRGRSGRRSRSRGKEMSAERSRPRGWERSARSRSRSRGQERSVGRSRSRGRESSTGRSRSKNKERSAETRKRDRRRSRENERKNDDPKKTRHQGRESMGRGSATDSHSDKGQDYHRQSDKDENTKSSSLLRDKASSIEGRPRERQRSRSAERKRGSNDSHAAQGSELDSELMEKVRLQQQLLAQENIEHHDSSATKMDESPQRDQMNFKSTTVKNEKVPSENQICVVNVVPRLTAERVNKFFSSFGKVVRCIKRGGHWFIGFEDAKIAQNLLATKAKSLTFQQRKVSLHPVISEPNFSSNDKDGMNEKALINKEDTDSNQYDPFKIFVGGLKDRGFNREKIRRIFSQFGEVADCRYIQQRTVEYAFVVFRKQSIADKVFSMTIDGSNIPYENGFIRIERAKLKGKHATRIADTRQKEEIQPKMDASLSSTDTLYVYGFPSDSTVDELKMFFSAFGDVEVRIPPQNSSMDKSYGFVTFKSKEDAHRLLREKKNGLIFKEMKLKLREVNEDTNSQGQPLTSPPGSGGGSGRYHNPDPLHLNSSNSTSTQDKLHSQRKSPLDSWQDTTRNQEPGRVWGQIATDSSYSERDARLTSQASSVSDVERMVSQRNAITHQGNEMMVPQDVYGHPSSISLDQGLSKPFSSAIPNSSSSFDVQGHSSYGLYASQAGIPGTLPVTALPNVGPYHGSSMLGGPSVAGELSGNYPMEGHFSGESQVGYSLGTGLSQPGASTESIVALKQRLRDLNDKMKTISNPRSSAEQKTLKAPDTSGDGLDRILEGLRHNREIQLGGSTTLGGGTGGVTMSSGSVLGEGMPGGSVMRENLMYGERTHYMPSSSQEREDFGTSSGQVSIPTYSGYPQSDSQNVLDQLSMGMIHTQTDVDAALEISNTLTKAVLNYQLKSTSQD